MPHTHSAASVCIYFHYLITIWMLIIYDNVWEAVRCRVRLRYGANQSLSTLSASLILLAIYCVTDQYNSGCVMEKPFNSV